MIGKAVGIFGTTYLVSRFTRATLDAGLHWLDVGGVALLGGIGFTVSLLIGELAFRMDSLHGEHVRVGVLAGSVLSAILAASILRIRNKAYRDIARQEGIDDDGDGIPDVFQG